MSSPRSGKYDHQPEPISRLIDAVFRSTGQTKTFNGWRVVTAWTEIVGEHLASKAKAVSFSDGVLLIEVADATWRQELTMKSGSILKTIHEQPYGRAVKKLQLVKRARTQNNGN